MQQTVARPGSSAEETRTRILAAAKEIYEAKGTRGTTTREVAERAGVNEATVFRHFGNKQAMLVAMREQSCAIEHFRSVIESLTGDVRSDLRTIGLSMAEKMHEQRAMMCISLAEDARGDGDRVSPEWRGPRRILERLGEYFSVQIARGVLHGDPDRMARFFMTMIFAYIVGRKMWHDGEVIVVKPADIDFLVGVFLNGVKQ